MCILSKLWRQFVVCKIEDVNLHWNSYKQFFDILKYIVLCNMFVCIVFIDNNLCSQIIWSEKYKISVAIVIQTCCFFFTFGCTNGFSKFQHFVKELFLVCKSIINIFYLFFTYCANFMELCILKFELRKPISKSDLSSQMQVQPNWFKWAHENR